MAKVFSLNETVFACWLSIAVYGVYGIMIPDTIDLKSDFISWIYLLLPILSTVAYLVIKKGTQDDLVKITFSLPNKKILHKLMLGLAASFIVVYLINQSLTGDELFYANYGFIHSLTALPIGSTILQNFQDIAASTVLRLFSLFLLLSLIVLGFILVHLNKSNYFFSCIFVVIILVFMRLFLVFLGGNPVIHAPLTGGYAMFVGTILGISDLALQSGQFLVYLSFGYFVFTKYSAALCNFWLGLLVTATVLSIPAFFFLGSVVEPAIWTVICYSIVLICLVDKKFSNYKTLVYVILLFSFFRIAAIFSIIPLLLHLIINGYLKGSLKNKLEALISLFSPILIFLPFFVFAYAEGSAATSGSVFHLSRLMEIIIDGTMWSVYSDVIPPYWLGLYFFVSCFKLSI